MDFDSSTIEELEEQSTDISVEENQNLDNIVPLEDVHSNVQPTEIICGDLHAPTDIMLNIDDSRSVERKMDECLETESECKNDATPDHVASVEEIKGINIATNSECNAMENDRGREVVQARDWVLIAAAILKQRGKEVEWEEIVNGWVFLQ